MSNQEGGPGWVMRDVGSEKRSVGGGGS